MIGQDESIENEIWNEEDFNLMISFFRNSMIEKFGKMASVKILQ